MSVMDLAEFVLARITEDEALLRDAPHVGCVEDASDESNVIHGALCVARVLAECAAKRRIVNLMRDGYAERDVEYWALHDALQYLTLPYVDHPDYDEAWRP